MQILKVFRSEDKEKQNPEEPYTNKYHCAKNHISQVLEYHRKPKKTMSNHLSINFLAEKKTVFPITKKFKTRTSQ